MARFIEVNSNDEIIGYKSKESFGKEDIGRVSALWIVNSREEILIAKRSSNKKFDPNKWGPAVAGTVEEGETYLSNIIKEAEEEIGLKIKEEDIKLIHKTLFEKNNKYFCQIYSAKIDLPVESFKIQEDEVAEVKWISKEELLKEVEENLENFVWSFSVIIEAMSEHGFS